MVAEFILTAAWFTLLQERAAENNSLENNSEAATVPVVLSAFQQEAGFHQNLLPVDFFKKRKSKTMFFVNVAHCLLHRATRMPPSVCATHARGSLPRFCRKGFISVTKEGSKQRRRINASDGVVHLKEGLVGQKGNARSCLLSLRPLTFQV